MELIKRRLSVVLAVLFCCFSTVGLTSCDDDDEDKEDFISKTATAPDGTKTEFKMTFKNGMSEFLFIKSGYPTEEAAIEAEKSVKDMGEDFDYVSHTRNGKVVETKYIVVDEMTKEEGLITLDFMAKSEQDPESVFEDLLGEMDGFDFDLDFE